MAKILKILMDIDGCFYHAIFPENYQAPLQSFKETLLQTNEELLKHLHHIIGEQQYHKIIVALGSNRQSKRVDDVNAVRSATFAPALPILQQYLQYHYAACEVVLDPFLMADIYSKDKFAGESYHAILKEHYQKTAAIHDDWIFDEKKFSLVYVQAHRLASLNHAQDLTLNFYDDQVEILEALSSCFTQFPELLPKGLNLNLFCYEGNAPILFSTLIGKGMIDLHYQWSMRFLFLKNFLRMESVGRETLQDYYKYSVIVQEKLMLVPMMIGAEDFGAFLKFRTQYVQYLADERHFFSRNIYLTAEKLVAEKLLPAELCFTALCPVTPDRLTLSINPPAFVEASPLPAPVKMIDELERDEVANYSTASRLSADTVSSSDSVLHAETNLVLTNQTGLKISDMSTAVFSRSVFQIACTPTTKVNRYSALLLRALTVAEAEKAKAPYVAKKKPIMSSDRFFAMKDTKDLTVSAEPVPRRGNAGCVLL
jgi:hypothetical protein